MTDYITYKEFQREVEAMGYRLEDEYGYIYVYADGEEDYSCAAIDRRNQYSVGMAYSRPCTEPLFDLCARLAKTPLDKREEPKRYRVRAVGHGPKLQGYMLTRHRTDHGGCVYYTNQCNSNGNQTFTQSELDEIAKTVPIYSEAYEIEEVVELFAGYSERFFL